MNFAGPRSACGDKVLFNANQGIHPSIWLLIIIATLSVLGCSRTSQPQSILLATIAEGRADSDKAPFTGAAAQNSLEATLAVSYFDNTSQAPELEPLKKGLADMLITDLSNVSALRLVEREELGQLLKEITLGQSEFIDPNTAQRIGKGLGAQEILTGAYFLYGDTLRIDVRLIKVETAEVLMAEEMTGTKASVFDMEKKLVRKILDKLAVNLSHREAQQVDLIHTESFEALTAYGTGLDQMDKGQLADARIAMDRALKIDPRFDLVKERLDIIDRRLGRIESKVDRELGSVESQRVAVTNTNWGCVFFNITDSQIISDSVWIRWQSQREWQHACCYPSAMITFCQIQDFNECWGYKFKVRGPFGDSLEVKYYRRDSNGNIVLAGPMTAKISGDYWKQNENKYDEMLKTERAKDLETK